MLALFTLIFCFWVQDGSRSAIELLQSLSYNSHLIPCWSGSAQMLLIYWSYMLLISCSYAAHLLLIFESCRALLICVFRPADICGSARIRTVPHICYICGYARIRPPHRYLRACKNSIVPHIFAGLQGFDRKNLWIKQIKADLFWYFRLKITQITKLSWKICSDRSFSSLYSQWFEFGKSFIYVYRM